MKEVERCSPGRVYASGPALVVYPWYKVTEREEQAQMAERKLERQDAQGRRMKSMSD